MLAASVLNIMAGSSVAMAMGTYMASAATGAGWAPWRG
jgi:hypothetical protein